MRQLFCLMILSSSSLLGQIKVTGHVTDMSGHPITYQSIHLNKKSIIRSDSNGYFEASTRSRSLDLVFRAHGYKMKKVTILKSGHIEVKLTSAFPAKDLFRSSKAISSIQNEDGTTQIYSIDTIMLVKSLNQKMVMWQLGDYEVYLPFDSLVSFLNIAPYRPSDMSFGLNYLKAHSNESIIQLSQEFLEKIGKRVLDDFAIEMIKENSIRITDKKGTIEQLILRDIFWNGEPKCSNCCWGGIQFLANGADILFSRTSKIC